MSASNPSAYKAVQKAQGDEIKDLKQKYSQLEALAADLHDDLAKATRDNKKLRDDVDTAVSAHEYTQNQLESIRAEQKTFRLFQSRATKLLAALTSGQNVDKIRGDILASALESQNPHEVLRAIVGDQSGSEHDDDGGDDESGAPAAPNEATTTHRIQDELRDSPKMLKVVSALLCRLFGATNRLKTEHMSFPQGFLPTDPGWPATGEGQDRQPYLRFDFTKKHDDPVNIEGFRQWCQHVRTRGADLVPESRSVLEQASDITIQARCRIKFEYQAGQYKKHLTNAQSETQAGDAADEDKTIPQLTLAAIRSRGEGKLKKRTRQLAEIPAGTYTEMECRTFLTLGAMSADEDEWVTGPDGRKQKTPNVYVSRPYSFLSDRFRDMKAHVDSIPDPSPPRGYTTRKVGEPHDGPPPRSQENQYALRFWMVKKDVLDANPEWIRTHRVIPDEEPVNGGTPSRKRKQATQPGTSAAGPSRVETKRVRSQLRQAEATYIADLGGHSLAELRDDLDNPADNEEEGDGGLDDGDGEGNA